MKKQVRIIVILLAIMLTSCSGGLPDMGIADLLNGTGNDVPQGFYENLANEYENLAQYQQEYRHKADEAEHFRAKARRVLRRQDVVPDQPLERGLAEEHAGELRGARVMLIDALENLNTAQNEALLAMAQSRYDCWLAYQKDYPGKNLDSACKDDFYTALALLTLPPVDKTIHSIYFDTGSIALNDQGKETIRSIADRYSERDDWVVILKGYTDTQGNRQQNKVLSMRRAIAVKHALAQYGIHLDNIAISAEGEARTAEGAEGRRVDIEVRPHYVARNKKGLRIAPGWQHSAEF